MADSDANKKLKVLIIADNFGRQLDPLTSEKPLGLFNVASVSLIDLTLEWVSRLDANVYIAISKADNQAVTELKSKWKPYIDVEILVFEACHSFGDVMRAVDKLHMFTHEFLLVENVPTFCSFNLMKNLEAFKELRKNRTANGKPILGKDNLMSMIFAHSATKQNLILLEKQTNRLLAYNPEGGITLTKKQFSAGCTARSDLKQSGIYFCAPEIITKFSDNVDAQSFNEQIGNILAQDETICEYIFADILPNNAFADTANDHSSIYDCLCSFLHQKYYPATFASLHPNTSKWGNSVALQFRENFVFVPQNFESPAGANNSVFGGSFLTKGNVTISGCFFGDNLKIGSGSELSQVIAGRNVQIGRNVRIKRAIINDNVQLGDDVEFSNCIIVGSNETIPFRSEKKAPGKIRLKSSASDAVATQETASSGIRAFDEEIRESIKNSLAAENWSDKERLKSLVLEINSSKLAYNISMDEVAKHIFLAFLQQSRFGPTINDMKELTKGWQHIWTNYYKPVNSKAQILHAIEEHVVMEPEWSKFAPPFVLFLYDLDVLTDDVIVEWYNELPATHIFKNGEFDRLVDWLEKDDESESEPSDDE